MVALIYALVEAGFRNTRYVSPLKLLFNVRLGCQSEVAQLYTVWLVSIPARRAGAHKITTYVTYTTQTLEESPKGIRYREARPAGKMVTTVERRRQQNRLAQRRYRQRRRQIATDPIFQTTSNAAGSVLMPTPLLVEIPEIPETPEQSPPWSAFAPATVDSTKSFCELVADSANLLLGGLGTINMDDVEVPSSFVASRRTGSPPTLTEVVEVLSKSRVYTRASSSSIDTHSTDPASQGNNRNADTDKCRRGWVAPLHMAAGKGQDKIIRTLLQHNADCNLRDGDGLTPLLHAVIGNYPETVTLLLSHGARIELVDRQNRSALHWATAQKQEAVLRILLEHCGERPPTMDKYDDNGMTPLHIAVDGDFEAGVQLLLQFGASVHCQVRQCAIDDVA
ncbi:hypothetical protein CHU98_g1345 [Xylaria longipes]|nr:hypothetical protein CHU98_g1345 [Xylaria longipes]